MKLIRSDFWGWGLSERPLGELSSGVAKVHYQYNNDHNDSNDDNDNNTGRHDKLSYATNTDYTTIILIKTNKTIKQ